MPSNIWDVEWLNQNGQRNYPLVDESTRADTTNSFKLPNDLIVDFSLVVHGVDLNPARFYIGSLSAFNHGYVLTVNYDNSVTSEIVAVVTILTSSHTTNKVYQLLGRSDSDAFFDCVGTITIGSLASLANFGGSYAFTLDSTRLNPALILSDIRAVTGLRVQTATGGSSVLLQGDVVLRAGNNIQFSSDGSNIFISAVGNENYTGVCSCSIASSGSPILSINGVGPDDSGNIQLIPGTSCLAVVPSSGTNSIELKDTCCEPCCGCSDLEVLTQQLKAMQTQLRDLENFATILEQSQSQIRSLIATVDTGDIG